MYVQFAQIEPTTRCNYTCGFCAGRHMAQQDISLETFKRFIDQTEGLRHLELQGEGEPLIHPHFFDMVRYAREKFPKVQVSMISNGSLFNKENIDKILLHDITRIFVSMESADDNRFQRIRGGKLERVRRGIRNLLITRNKKGAKAPVLGLAVTLLKSTVNEPTEAIQQFYNDLGLDGGIMMQPLQRMPQYTRFYPEEMIRELPDQEDIVRLNESIMCSPSFQCAMQQRGQQPGFYENLYGSVNTNFECPWLANGIYVSTQGQLLPCCQIKDYATHALSELDSSSDTVPVS